MCFSVFKKKYICYSTEIANNLLQLYVVCSKLQLYVYILHIHQFSRKKNMCAISILFL